MLWQASADSIRALVAAPSFVESQWLSAAAAVQREHRVSISLVDRQGRPLLSAAPPVAVTRVDSVGDAGTGETPQAGGADSRLRANEPFARRTAAQADLPWDVSVGGDDALEQSRQFAATRQLLVGGFALLVAMALTASYLILRAVGRELAVARLQSDFVAAVSHEFRTPLTALRQFTDMLREHGPLDEERRRLCYEAQSRATDRLTRLVESLLDFGRMEAGARLYRFEPFDCSDLVDAVVEEFRREIRAAGYQVDVHGNGSAPIEGDREALSRALWNLLDNAVKYSPGHRTIDVRVERMGDQVSIAVRDHGIGVLAGERALIFGRFQRGEQARTRGITGTGIGLAMVDQIVRAHHGRVECESHADGGTTFAIHLKAASSLTSAINLNSEI